MGVANSAAHPQVHFAICDVDWWVSRGHALPSPTKFTNGRPIYTFLKQLEI